MKENFRIYLCRHAEAYSELEGIFGGDHDLTPQGCKQAVKLAHYLENKNIHVIYTSPRIRAVKTAEVIHAHLPSTEFIRVPELADINYGSLDGFTVEEFQMICPEEASRREKDKYRWRLSDGESYADVFHRLKPFLDRLYVKEGNHVIVSHRIPNRIILWRHFYQRGIPREVFLDMEILHEIVFELFFHHDQPSHIRRDINRPQEDGFLSLEGQP